MQPRLQRLLVFFVLCAVFGSAVWLHQVGSLPRPQALVAQVTAPAVGTAPLKAAQSASAKPPEEGKIDQPPPSGCGTKEVLSADKSGSVKVDSSKVHESKCEQVIILVGGKTCMKFFQCRYRSPTSAETYCAFTNTNCPTSLPAGASGRAQVASDSAGEYVENPTVVGRLGTLGESPAIQDALGGGKVENVAYKPPTSPYPGPAQPSGNPGSIKPSESSPPSTVSTAPTPASRIGDMADAGGANAGGQTSVSGAGTGQPTFSPSPQLSGSPFNLGSLFGGGGSPSAGSGQAGSGGTIAYVPVNQYPGLTSPNFDTRGTDVTFPPSQPSPGDLLAYLAQNTKRMKADGFTAEELADRGVVNTVILQAINNVVTPVGDFIRSFFTAEDVSKPTGEEVSAVAREEKPPLERGRLVLILSADDSLVPGDPTLSTVLVPDEEYESFESIPSSNRAWVENAPRAGERIDSLAGAPPTYGWGEPPQIEERGGVSEGDAPQISDVSYDPFLPRFGFEGEAEEGSGTEPPRSFFSVMGRSFGTIIDAVGNLFANIGKALFWWL